MKWLFKPKRVVVLDIGSHTLKLSDFSIKKKRPFLRNFAFLPVPEGCVEQGDVLQVEPFKEVLPGFIAKNTQNPEFDLYVSMGGKSVIVKKMQVMRSAEELMNDLVQEEVSQSLPFNLDEINYDYTPMITPQPPPENKVNILLVAAKSESVYKVDQIVEQAGHHCRSIDMGAFALSECVKWIYPECVNRKENILILDIGKSGTKFVVLHRGNLIFFRYMMIGSDFYTVSLMKEMGIDYQEAESLKISWCAGDEAPKEINSIMLESDTYFCDEIFIGLEYFKSQFPEEVLSRAYVTGGGSKMSNLVTAIGSKFDISIRLLNIFGKLESSESLKSSIDHIMHFAPNSVGTCLRELK